MLEMFWSVTAELDFLSQAIIFIIITSFLFFILTETLLSIRYLMKLRAAKEIANLTCPQHLVQL
tara:strand:+ start:23707 stop:23898 length:192 start_codon:yes stop_codon:yes gene_type:complete